MTDPRARITAGELVVILSRYDLGAIESVTRFRGGSRQSPKVLVVSQRGRFLLKRRAVPSGNVESHAQRVAFAHAVGSHLSSRGFPVAELLSTRAGERSVRDADGQAIYELFRFVEGDRYDRRPESAFAAGNLLARFHAALSDWPVPTGAPTGTYHARAQFPDRLQAARDRIADPRARPLTVSLGDLYAHAAGAAEALGVSVSPAQVIHGDWHPGNMIFRLGTPERIGAVVDLDSARVGPLIVDVANGALQFGVMRALMSPEDSRAGATPPIAPHAPGSDPHAWRIALDPDLIEAFCAGYRQGARAGVLSSPELRRAVPLLMAEALVVEAVLPIAATGAFGRLDPLPLLALVEQTASSILAEQDRLVDLAGGGKGG